MAQCLLIIIPKMIGWPDCIWIQAKRKTNMQNAKTHLEPLRVQKSGYLNGFEAFHTLLQWATSWRYRLVARDNVHLLLPMAGDSKLCCNADLWGMTKKTARSWCEIVLVWFPEQLLPSIVPERRCGQWWLRRFGGRYSGHKPDLSLQVETFLKNLDQDTRNAWKANIYFPEY